MSKQPFDDYYRDQLERHNNIGKRCEALNEKYRKIDREYETLVRIEYGTIIMSCIFIVVYLGMMVLSP